MLADDLRGELDEPHEGDGRDGGQAASPRRRHLPQRPAAAARGRRQGDGGGVSGGDDDGRVSRGKQRVRRAGEDDRYRNDIMHFLFIAHEILYFFTCKKSTKSHYACDSGEY